MKSKAKGPICLFLCSLFWGMAFSAQSTAMEHMGPYTFVFFRSIITSAVLFCAHPLMVRTHLIPAEKRENPAKIWKIGALCGIFLVSATLFQQIGLVTTTTAKSSFITAMYIVMVPIFGLFLGKKPQITIALGVVLSLAGLYFLCMKGSFEIEFGDLITLCSAIVFAIHILVIDHFGGDLDSVKLSAIQFLTAAVVSGILAFTLETPSLSQFAACWTSVIYVAVFSGALGYTLQIVGQKSTDPTLASLIMCLESVFGAIGGWILLGETLAGLEILGCVLMLSGSVVALIPAKKKA